jgi:hypothetical protein
MASFLGEPYKYPSSSNGSPSWSLHSTGAKAHFLHLQRPKSLSTRAFISSSWSRDWVKEGYEFLMWFMFLSLSWLLNLHPPRLLLLEPCSSMVRCCPWAIALCGEPWKVCITLICNSEQLKIVFVTTWVRKGLRETRFFVNPSTRTYDSLWIWTSRLNIVSLVCSYTYLLYYCYLPSCRA